MAHSKRFAFSTPRDLTIFPFSGKKQPMHLINVNENERRKEAEAEWKLTEKKGKRKRFKLRLWIRLLIVGFLL